MRKALILLLMIPVLTWAQTPEKYLAGAVPVKDGKVSFNQTINIQGLSKDAIYNMVLHWAEKQFQTNEKFPGNKMISAEPETGQIAAIGEEYVIFSSSALSLDRTRIYYQFIAECNNGKCDLTITRIRYWYNEARDGGERYNAEDIITDEYGLNKKKNKLARVVGKFREKTIDYKDDLFKSVATSITEQLQKSVETPKEEVKEVVETAAPSVVNINTANIVAMPKAPVNDASRTKAAKATTIVPESNLTTQTNTTPVVVYNEKVSSTPVNSTTTTPKESDMSGYNRISPKEIPGNICQMLSEDWMLITAGTDEKFNMMTASWGGLGYLYQKPVAFCFINPSRYTYQLMEKNDTYTLTFYRESNREALKICGSLSGKDVNKVKASGLTPITTPQGSKAFKEAWLIIECKKLVAQSLNHEALKNDSLKQEWEGKAMHKMYIGEIINVWMR